MVALVANELAAERDRWVLWLPVFLGLGVGAYFLLPREPAPILGPLLFISAALPAVRGRRRAPSFLIAVIAACVALGFSAASLRTARVSAPVLEARIGPVWVQGRAVEVSPQPHGYRVLIDEPRISDLEPWKWPDRVRVVVRTRGDPVRPGDRFSILAVLMPPAGPSEPGAFDFARWAFFQKIGAVGFAVGPARLRERREESWLRRAGDGLAGLREDIARRVRNQLPEREGAVAAALMTGVRGAIPEEVIADMRDSGLAHLLAISGLHMGLVAGLLFFTLRLLLASSERVALRHPIKKWAALAALMGAGGYLMLTGAPISAQRAFVMTALMLGAVLLDRTALSMRLVCWAAVVILLLSPESLLSAGFQMSFAAVVCLVAVYEGMRGKMGEWRRDQGLLRRLQIYFLGVALTTLVAGLATAPFAAFHFNRFVTYGLLANLVAVPLTGFWIMPWAILAFLLMPLGLEGLALSPMGWGINAVLKVAELVAGLPGGVLLVPAVPGVALALVALGGLWLAIWHRSWRFYGLFAIAGGAAFLLFAQGPDLRISASGKLIALRDGGGGLLLSSGRSEKFTRDQWLRRDGLDGRDAEKWPKSGASRDGRLRCDDGGCIWRVKGWVVALPRRESALAEDCRNADVVLTSLAVGQRCSGPRLVIDRHALDWGGARAILLHEKGPAVVRTVREETGDRPWNGLALSR